VILKCDVYNNDVKCVTQSLQPDDPHETTSSTKMKEGLVRYFCAVNRVTDEPVRCWLATQYGDTWGLEYPRELLLTIAVCVPFVYNYLPVRAAVAASLSAIAYL
jgi:hypothetical protein